MEQLRQEKPSELRATKLCVSGLPHLTQSGIQKKDSRNMNESRFIGKAARSEGGRVGPPFAHISMVP